MFFWVTFTFEVTLREGLVAHFLAEHVFGEREAVLVRERFIVHLLNGLLSRGW
jgi:hypothetical protein